MNVVVGLIVVMIVGFFAYQWYAVANRTAAPRPGSVKQLVTPPTVTPPPMAEATPSAPKEEQYPVVPGQTEGELRAKEPIQAPMPANDQLSVTMDGKAPADFTDTLRHPEQMFHQPPAGSMPTMQISDVPAGRAGSVSTPGAGFQQGFAPEMAQNGGPVVGNSVFAFDGMEPTGFAAF